MADTITQLVQAQGRSRAKIESQTEKLLARLLAAMGGDAWYEPARQQQFTRDASTAVRTAQEALAGVTSAYLDRIMVELGSKQSNRPFVLPTQLRQVDIRDEWQRPAEQFRYARSAGKSDDEAHVIAARRAQSLALDDVQLAQQTATTLRLQDYPKVTGYRRVIHPELSVGGTCGLCAVASDRVYRVNRLMPVHDRCHCGVLPITADHDPGSALNTADLEDLYRQAAAAVGDESGRTSDADALKRARFKVAEHNELGPRLVDDQESRPEHAPTPEPVVQVEREIVQVADSNGTETPTRTVAAKPVGGLTDDELENEMSELMSDPDGYDNPRMDELAEEMDRRDQERRRAQERAAAEAAAAAERDARFAEQQAQAEDEAAERERLGYGAGGKQWRRNAGQGAKAFRDEYETWIEVQYTTADAELNGVLLSKEGRVLQQRGDLDVRDLFTRKRRSLRYASEELQEWFSRNPRMSFPEFEAGSRDDDVGRAARTRAGNHRWESEFG